MVPRGRGRGALQGAPPVTMSSSSPYFLYNQSPANPLMDLRITEIIDVTTFWGQVGTAKQLSDFDQFCVSLSAQCEDQETSSRDTPIIVGHIVPVKDAAVPGVWHRARVTRILPSRIVEVHFIDTGKSGRVSISDLCTHVPELTLQIPSQALQCNLDGVTMVKGDDVIREAAIARLSEIVSRPLKTIIHSICDDVFFLSAYTRQGGYWTSVGEILRLESLVMYTPPGSLTVDHLVSPSSPPRGTTPPDDESDSSTLIDIEVSHSLKWSDTKTKTRPSSSVSIPEVAVCNDLVSLSDDEAAVSDSMWLTPPSDKNEMQSLNFSLVSESVETELRATQSPGPFTPTETPPNEVEWNSDLSLSPLVTTAEPSIASTKLVIPFSSLSLRCSARSNALSYKKENESPNSSSSVDGESDVLEGSSETTESDSTQATTTAEADDTLPNTDTLETVGQNASSSDRKDVTSSLSRRDSSTIEEKDTEQRETDRPSSVSEEHSATGKHSPSITKQDSTPSKKVSPDSSRSPTHADHTRSPTGAGHKGSDEAGSEEESDDDDVWDESLLPPRSGGSQPGSNSSTPVNTPEKNPPTDERCYHGSKNRDKVRARFEAVMGSGESFEQRQSRSNWTGGKKYSKRSNSGHSWQQNYTPRPRPNNWRAPVNGQNGSFGQNRFLGRGARIREDNGGNWSHPSCQDEGHQLHDFARGSRYDNSSPRFATPRSEGGNFEPLSQPNRRLEPPSSFAPCPVERGGGESTTTQFVTPKSETRSPAISLEAAAQKARLSAEAITNECNWNAWMMQNNMQKVVSNLTQETVKEFGQQIQDILNGTSAKTLTTLQYEKQPLTVVFNSVLSQVTTEKADLIAEAIFRAVTNFRYPSAYNILQDCVRTAAEEVSVGSADTSAPKKRGNFCSFVQRLFISASCSGNEEYSKCIGLSVKRCLKSWINCSTEAPQLEQLACAECFVALCDNIGPTLDAFSKESLDEYFKGPVRESILCNDRPREVKEQLLDLSLRRVGNWDGAKPQKPSEEVALPTSQNSSEPSSNCSPHAQATSPVPPTSQPPSNTAQNVSPLSPNILQQQFSKQHISSPPFPSAFPQQMFPMPPNVQSMSGPLSPPAVLQSPSYPSQQFSQSMLQSPSSTHGYPSPGGSERQGMFSSQQLASNQGQFPQYYVNSQQCNTMPSLPQPQQQQQQQQPDIFDDGDPYRQTLEMLEMLGFPELLPNFKQHMLRDFVFDLEDDTLIKECLTSAQLPLGAVVGIMSFLENKRKMKKHHQRKPSTQRLNSHIPNSPLQSPYQFDVCPSPQAMLPRQMPPTPPLEAYRPPPALQPFMQAGMSYAGPNPVTPSSTITVTQASVPQAMPITLPAAEVSTSQLPSPVETATTAEADSSGGVTVRRPSAHRNWHKPESESPKDGVHSSSKPQVGGGFGKFSCILCHSNEHSTMACEHRDRFFVHM